MSAKSNFGIISAIFDPIESSLHIEGWSTSNKSGSITIHHGDMIRVIEVPATRTGRGDPINPKFWSINEQLQRGTQCPLPKINVRFGKSTRDEIVAKVAPKILISSCERKGGKLEVTGWCVGRDEGDFVAIYLFENLLGKALVSERPDVEAQYPWLKGTMPGFRYVAQLPQDFQSGRLWVEAKLRRDAEVVATSCKSIGTRRKSSGGNWQALGALLNDSPPAGSLRKVARSITPTGRRRLLASRAFAKMWREGPESPAMQLRREIVLAMLELGEIAGPMEIRLRSEDSIIADPVRDAVIARRFLLDGTYEEGLIESLGQFLKPGDTMFDVGSCYGHVALACATIVGKQGKVIAVEPNPNMAPAIRKAAARNSKTQVQVAQSALGNTIGEVTLKVVPSNVGGSRLGVAGISESDAELNAIMKKLTVVSLKAKDLGRPVKPDAQSIAFETVRVNMRTLDDLCKEHGLPNLIKIDIEGAELLCLRGATQLLSGGFGPKPVIAMEYSNLFPTFGGERESAFRLLADAGYVAHRMKGGKVRGGDLIEIPDAENAPQHDDLFFIPR